MTLEDIYNSLSFGELRMLFMSGKSIDGPTTEGMPVATFLQLLPSIQLGLTELYKRFSLSEGHFKLVRVDGVDTYHIKELYSMSANPNGAMLYIDDTEMPLQNNLLKLLRCYGTQNDRSIEIPMNQIANPAAIRTTSYNSMTVPNDPVAAPWLVQTPEIEVVYRANHPEINKYIANEAPLITDIYLPPSHLEALLYYVASRVFNPIGMVPDSVHEGNNYAQKFEVACQRLSMENYQVDQDAENEKLAFRGFC